MSTAEPSIFVSYVSDDREIVDEVASYLARLYTVFVDHEEIKGGDDWIERLERALHAAVAVVVVVNETTWAKSKWAKRERLLAARLGKPMVPVLIEGEMPFEIIDRQFVDLRGDFGAAMGDLVSALSTHAEPTDRGRDEIDSLLGRAIRARIAGMLAKSDGLVRQAMVIDPLLADSPQSLWAACGEATPKSSSVSLADFRIREQTRRLDESIYEDGRRTYQWSVELVAAPSVLSAVEHVAYDVSKYFRGGPQVIRSPEHGFRISKSGWGPIPFRIAITLHSGERLETWYDLTLKPENEVPPPTEPFPRWA